MPSTISRSNRSRRLRAAAVGRGSVTRPVTPIQVVMVTVSTTTVTVVFDQPVSCSGTPQYSVNVHGPTLLSAALVNPTTLELTFSASVAAATLLSIPFEEPCVRNASGGFVATNTFTI